MNTLFPVFLKLDELVTLIIGGGNVAEEKLGALLKNSPASKIIIVGSKISRRIKEIANEFRNIQLIERPYRESDIAMGDILIAAVNNVSLCEEIRISARRNGKLINVADKPALCDFYLGSIVQKGSLKLGISTNGKSPTIAKRLKEVLHNSIPDELESVLDNLESIRNKLKGDFSTKVSRLNEITSILKDHDS